MSMSGGVLGGGGLGDVLPSDIPEGFEDLGGPGPGAPRPHQQEPFVQQPWPVGPEPGVRGARRGHGHPAMPGTAAAGMGMPMGATMVRQPVRQGLGMGQAAAVGAISAATVLGLLAVIVAVARKKNWDLGLDG